VGKEIVNSVDAQKRGGGGALSERQQIGAEVVGVGLASLHLLLHGNSRPYRKKAR